MDHTNQMQQKVDCIKEKSKNKVECCELIRQHIKDIDNKNKILYKQIEQNNDLACMELFQAIHTKYSFGELLTNISNIHCQFNKYMDHNKMNLFYYDNQHLKMNLIMT